MVGAGYPQRLGRFSLSVVVTAATLLVAPLVAQAGDEGPRTATSPQSAGSDSGDASLFDRYLLSEDVSGVEAYSAASSSPSHPRPWGWRGHGRRGEPPCVTRPPARPEQPPTDEEPAPTAPEPQPSPEAAFVPEPTALAMAAEYGAPPMLGDFFTSGGSTQFQLRPFVGPAIEDIPGTEFQLLQGDDLDTSSPAAQLGDRFFQKANGFPTNPQQVVEGLAGFEQEGGNVSPLSGTFQARPTDDQVLATDSFGTTTIRDLYNIHAESNVTMPAHLSQAFNSGILKFAEGGSPLPVDRLIFNYHYFDNTALFQGGVNVHRFVPGFEKTFFDGLASIEVRAPLLVTLDSDVDIQNPGATDTQHGEFGNVRITPKVLLHRERGLAVGAGLPILVPTADDIVFEIFNTEFARVENEAVHIAPYLGAVYAPNRRFFTQGFLQFDFDANGNPVSMRLDPFNSLGGGVNERRIGRLNDPTFLFLDWQAGYWFHRATDPRSTGLTGLAGLFELHYSGSLDETDAVISRFERTDEIRAQFGVERDNIDVLNLTIGSVLEFDYNSSLLLGYSVPVGEGADEPFDGELRVLFTHRFGPPSPLQQTVF